MLEQSSATVHGSSHANQPAGFEVVRAYDPATPGRYRVLIDRLWPRGVSKRAAELDEWMREAAPSAELRRWYGHDPAKFAGFARRYRDELGEEPGATAVARLLDLARSRPIALVTATRDVEHSGAQVLLDHLLDRRTSVSRTRPPKESLR